MKRMGEAKENKFGSRHYTEDDYFNALDNAVKDADILVSYNQIRDEIKGTMKYFPNQTPESVAEEFIERITHKMRESYDWVTGKNAGAYKFADALRKNDFTVEKEGPDEIVVDYGGEKVYVQSILDYWYDYNDEEPIYGNDRVAGKLHFYLDKFPDDKLEEAIHISTLEEIARSLDDISVRKAGLKWRWSPTDYDSLHLVAYNDRIPDEKALMRVLNDAFGNEGILLARDPVIKRLDGDELVTIYNFRCGDWDHKPTVREARLNKSKFFESILNTK